MYGWCLFWFVYGYCVVVVVIVVVLVFGVWYVYENSDEFFVFGLCDVFGLVNGLWYFSFFEDYGLCGYVLIEGLM